MLHDASAYGQAALRSLEARKEQDAKNDAASKRSDGSIATTVHHCGYRSLRMRYDSSIQKLIQWPNRPVCMLTSVAHVQCAS
jgi:hypothetical protein